MFDAIRFHHGLVNLQATQQAGYPAASYSNFQVRLPNPLTLAERNHLAHVHGAHVRAPLAQPRIPNRSKTVAGVAIELARAALEAFVQSEGFATCPYAGLVEHPVAKRLGFTLEKAEALWRKSLDTFLDEQSAALAGRWHAEAQALLAAEKEARALSSMVKIPTDPDKRMAANVRALALVLKAAAESRSLTAQERADVMAYTGFGGLGKFFGIVNNQFRLRDQYAKQYPLPGEYRPSEPETQYEYFTPPLLCDAIARTVEPLLGAAENAVGKIIALEPSAGVGRLVEPFTEHDVKWTLVEYNRAQSRLLESLYPTARVHGETMFEQFAVENGAELQGQYNLIVANPPYGKWQGAAIDRAYVKYADQSETYFLLRCLPMLARNGVAVFVLPSRILSGDKDKPTRQKMLEHWHLAAAARLPAGVFQGVAMMIDVLFCVGRGGKLNVPSEDQYIVDGQYFDQHPTHVLGAYMEGGGRYGQGQVKKTDVDPYQMDKILTLRPMGAQVSYNGAKHTPVDVAQAPNKTKPANAKAADKTKGEIGPSVGKQVGLSSGQSLDATPIGARDRLVLSPMQRHIARACLLSEYVPRLRRLSEGNATEWEEGRTAHEEMQYCAQALCRYFKNHIEAIDQLRDLAQRNVTGAAIFLNEVYPVGGLFAWPAQNATQLRDANSLALQRFPLGGTVRQISDDLQVASIELVPALIASGWYLVPPLAPQDVNDNTLELIPQAEFAVRDVGLRYARCARLRELEQARADAAVDLQAEWDAEEDRGWARFTDRKFYDRLRMLALQMKAQGIIATTPLSIDSMLKEYIAEILDFSRMSRERAQAKVAMWEACIDRYGDALQTSLNSIEGLTGFDAIDELVPFIEFDSLYASSYAMGQAAILAAAEFGVTLPQTTVIIPVARLTTKSKKQAFVPKSPSRAYAWEFYQAHVLNNPVRKEVFANDNDIDKTEFFTADESEGVLFTESPTDLFGDAVLLPEVIFALNVLNSQSFQNLFKIVACGPDWYVGPDNMQDNIGYAFTVILGRNKARKRSLRIGESRDASAPLVEGYKNALQNCPSMPDEARKWILERLPEMTARALFLLAEKERIETTLKGDAQAEAAASLQVAMAALISDIPTTLQRGHKLLSDTSQFVDPLEFVNLMAEPDGIWFAVSPLGNGVIGWPSREMAAFIEASLTGYEYGVMRYNPSADTDDRVNQALRLGLTTILSSDAAAQEQFKHSLRTYAAPYIRPSPSKIITGLTRWRGRSEGGVDLLPHQAQGAWQTFYDEGALMAFDVGVGKTYCGTATIIQHRQYAGLRKPVMVLPNPLTYKWCRDFARCAPDYAVAVLGDTFHLVQSKMTGQVEVASVKDKESDLTAKVRDFNAGLYDVLFIPRQVVPRLNPSLNVIAAFAQRLADEDKQVVYKFEQARKPPSRKAEVKAWEPVPDKHGNMWTMVSGGTYRNWMGKRCSLETAVYSRQIGIGIDKDEKEYVVFLGKPVIESNVPDSKQYVWSYKHESHAFELAGNIAEDLQASPQTFHSSDEIHEYVTSLSKRGLVPEDIERAKGVRFYKTFADAFLIRVGLLPPHTRDEQAEEEGDPSLYETWSIAILYLLGIKVQARARQLARLASGFAPIYLADGSVQYSAADQALFAQAVADQWREHQKKVGDVPPVKDEQPDTEREEDAEESDEMDEADDAVEPTGLPWNRIAIGHEDIKPDLVVIDEAQMFKNLWFPRKFVSAQVRFLGSPQTSSQAASLDAWLACTRLTQKCKVQLLSATPAKNSPIELYTMLSYISPEWLRQRAVRDVQRYADRFLRVGTTLYVKSNGDMESNAKAVMAFNDIAALRSILFRFSTFLDSEQAAELLPVDQRAMFAKPRPNRINMNVVLSESEQAEVAALRACVEEIANAKKKIGTSEGTVQPLDSVTGIAEKDGSNTMVVLSQLPRVGAAPEMSMLCRPLYTGLLLFRPDTLSWMVVNLEEVEYDGTLDDLYDTSKLIVPTAAQKRAVITKAVKAFQEFFDGGGKLTIDNNNYDQVQIAEIMSEAKAYQKINCGWKMIPPRWWWEAATPDEKAFMVRSLNRWQVRAYVPFAGEPQRIISAAGEGLMVQGELRRTLVPELSPEEGLIAMEQGNDGGAIRLGKGSMTIADYAVTLVSEDLDTDDDPLLDRPKRTRTTIASWVDKKKISAARKKHAELVRKATQQGTKSPGTEDEYIRSVLAQSYIPLLPDGNKEALRKTLLWHFDPSQDGENFWEVMPYEPSERIQILVKRVMSYDRSKAQIIFCLEKDMQIALFWALVSAGFPQERIGIMNADTAPTPSAKLEFANAFNGTEDIPDSAKLDIIIANSVAYEGIDLQVRTVAIHHFDLPWEPATLTQRNGRAWRQGNKNPQVDILYYTAANSADGYRMQMLEGKSGWISQIVKSEAFALANPTADPDATREQTFMSMCPDEEAAALVAARFAELRRRAEQAERAAKSLRTLGRACNFSHDLIEADYRGRNAEQRKIITTQKDSTLQELESDVLAGVLPYGAYVQALRAGKEVRMILSEAGLRPVMVGDVVSEKGQQYLILRFREENAAVLIQSNNGRFIFTKYFKGSVNYRQEVNAISASMREWLLPLREAWEQQIREDSYFHRKPIAADAEPVVIDTQTKREYVVPVERNRVGGEADYAAIGSSRNMWTALAFLTNEQLELVGWAEIKEWLLRGALHDQTIMLGFQSNRWKSQTHDWRKAFIESLWKMAVATEINEAGEKVAVTRAQWEAALRRAEEYGQRDNEKPVTMPERLLAIGSEEMWLTLMQTFHVSQITVMVDDLRRLLTAPQRTLSNAHHSIPVLWKKTGQIGIWYPAQLNNTGFSPSLRGYDSNYNNPSLPALFWERGVPGYVQLGKSNVTYAQLADSYELFMPASIEEMMQAVEIIQPNSEGAALMLQAWDRARIIRPDGDKSGLDPWFSRYWPYDNKVPSAFW